MTAAFSLVSGLVLAAVFGTAALAKVFDLAGTRKALHEFGAPAFLAPALSLVLPFVELAVAIALLLPATRTAGAAGALGLLAVFSFAIAASLRRGKAPDCHCFGQLHSAPTGWRTLVRNGCLGVIAAGTLVASRRDAGPSPWGWLTGRSAAELGLIVGLLAVTAFVTSGGLALVSLTRAYGRVLLRLEATERALLDAGIQIDDPTAVSMSELGLDPGTPAPTFEVKGSGGDAVTLTRLLAPELPLLLVFTSPGCGPCHALLPTIADWQHEHADRLTVAVACAGETEAIGEQKAEHGLGLMLVDTDGTLAEAFLATGTPSAVLIATDGTIASYLAAGSDEIESLVESLVATPADEGLPVGSPAPSLELRAPGGALVPLVDPLGKSTVVLFWNPGCGYCQSLLPALLEWERERHFSSPRLLVVSSGEEQETVADGFRSTVVVDPDFEVGRAFEVGGTPMAVVVDADGKVASPLIAGGDAVLAQLRGLRASARTASVPR